MSRNLLFDPASGISYAWPVNHKAVEKAERTRELAELVPTGAGWVDGVRPTIQAGDATPYTLRITGRLWDEAQLTVIQDFVRATKGHTVVFQEPSGERYEVLIEAFEPKRVAVVRAPNGGRYVWDYALEMTTI